MRAPPPLCGEGCPALCAGSVHSQAVVARGQRAASGLRPLSSAAPRGKASVLRSSDDGPKAEPLDDGDHAPVCQARCPPGRHACIPAHETAGQWEWVLAPKMGVPLPAERDGVRLSQRARDHQRLQAAHSLRLTQEPVW